MAKEEWVSVKNAEAIRVMTEARRRLVDVDPQSPYLRDTKVRKGIFLYAAGSDFERNFFGDNPKVGTPVGASYAFSGYVERVSRAQSQQARLDFGAERRLFA